VKNSVPTNVDYRRTDTCATPGACDIGAPCSFCAAPHQLGACLRELVADLHTVCWDTIRRETGARKLVAEYVLTTATVPLPDAWKTVTCPVCSDTWRLSGYGLSGAEVAAVRQGLLAAVCLAV
jgi:hypothetical protein